MESAWLPQSKAIYERFLQREAAGELKLIWNSTEFVKQLKKDHHDHRRNLFPSGLVDDPVHVFDAVLYETEESGWFMPVWTSLARECWVRFNKEEVGYRLTSNIKSTEPRSAFIELFQGYTICSPSRRTTGEGPGPSKLF